MSKLIAIKPENHPDVEEAHKAILEFAKDCKEFGITSVTLVGISPSQKVASTMYVSGNDHLRLLALLGMVRNEFEAELLEELRE
jgi:hypothetical protein